MDMKTRNGNLHLEIQSSRKNPVGVLRTSFYDSGKVKHTQHGRITGCSISQLKLLQLAFRENVIAADDPQAFQILQSKEYGASLALLEIIKQTGLKDTIYSRKEEWVNSVLAMIIGRIIYAGSKLSLSHLGDVTSLWEICGIDGKVDVDKHCYVPMDRLLSRQEAIQQKLAEKHLGDGKLVLYDITSSYLEGEYNDSRLVDFGYNRDGKKGHEQIVIGLICNSSGCPVGVEVFSGNTKDGTTVIKKIDEIKNTYGINDAVFVGDRGMITKHNLEYTRENGIKTITALTRNAINKLLEDKIIQPSLFDETNICEVVDSNNPVWRYCLCKNPIQAQKNKATRNSLLERTIEKLDQIVNYKRATTVAVLGSRIGKIFAQYCTGKYINWSIKADSQEQSKNHKITWTINHEIIEAEEQLDGCYIITSDVRAEDMTAKEIVESYKKLINVEKAFRNLKTVKLEIRPIYHKKDERIKAHVFLCMLAYYVQWHMQQLLKSLTEESNGKNRRYTFDNIIETLKQITRNIVSVGDAEFYKISQPTPAQQSILELLQIKF
jgi:transposase